MNTSTKIILIALITVASLSTVALYTENIVIEVEKNRVSTTFSNRVTLLANAASDKLDNAIRIVELTATQPDVRNADYSNFISESYMGIPRDKDVQKRQIAKTIQKLYPEFEVITFHMPNGDFYMMEPYETQLKITRLNFADRDWYREVLETKKTYVSDGYESTRHNVVAVRTPIYGDDGSLIGMWGGNMDLSFLKNVAKDLILDDSVRILFYDQYDKLIFDTNDTNPTPDDLSQKIVDFLPSNSKTFVLDSPHMLVSFAPVRAGTSHWTAVVVQPYDDAFSVIKAISNRTIIMISSLIGIVGFSSYFTYRMFRANELLTAQLRQKDNEEFAAMVAHELKTPITPISGYAELFLDGSLGSMTETQKEKMHIIYENSIRLTTSIQGILDIHKLELGQMKLDFQYADLNEITKRSIDIFRPIADQKEIVLLNETRDIIVRCDSDRILQVLNNVMSNAMKFVPTRHGKISISSRVENGLVMVGISDNGIGIPKDKQGDLFKKFYQVDRTLTRKAGGTGLGLAISRGIIESHGGKIWVESKENEGTVVYFTLPKGGNT